MIISGGENIYPIETFSEDKLARFKVPKRLKVLDELPRNAIGKVLKTMLRDEFSELS